MISKSSIVYALHLHRALTSVVLSTRDVSALRNLLSQRFPGTEMRVVGKERIQTGDVALDDLLGGGFPSFGLSEWIGPGGGAIGRLTVARISRDGGRTIWIDTARSLTHSGLPQNMVVVRPTEAMSGLAIAEAALRSGAFSFSVVAGTDLHSGAAVRLMQACREGRCTALVLGRMPTGAVMRVNSRICSLPSPFTAELEVAVSGARSPAVGKLILPILDYEVPPPLEPEMDDRRGDA